jgi:surface protein
MEDFDPTSEIHPVDEDRYEFVIYLYRIRKQYRRMGLFQPDFICIIFGPMMVSRYIRTDADIKSAVNDWYYFSEHKYGEFKYGHINQWNTSQVTNMGELFSMKGAFNEDISNWDVCNVTNMAAMFLGTRNFNGDISKWDVSNVTNMSEMFKGALKFDGNLNSWNVSNVTDMSWMFHQATSFNGNLSSWDVSNVATMQSIFYEANSFNAINGSLIAWNPYKWFSSCTKIDLVTMFPLPRNQVPDDKKPASMLSLLDD